MDEGLNKVSGLSVGARRSALNFVVFVAIAVGMVIFILKEVDRTIAEIDKLQETIAYDLKGPSEM